MNPFKYIIFCAVLTTVVFSQPTVLFADTEVIDDEIVVKRYLEIDLGYQGFSLDDNANRAGEYRSFTSSPTFGIKAFKDDEGKNFHVESTFLSDEDYNAEVSYNHHAVFRLDLRTERFYHNLDHIPYDNGYTGSEIYPIADDIPLDRNLTSTPVEGSRPDGTYTDDSANPRVRTYYTDQDPADRYGLRLNLNEAKFRIKHPSYPAHINFSYWRYEKEGEKQLRFLGENCTTACHMQSKTKSIDRVTEEVKAEVDAHVGFIDLALEALVRTFRDRQPIELDTFGLHDRGRDPGIYEHSEDPDSKIYEYTIKANTAPSGGLVGSASLTLGERENRSKVSSVSPVIANSDYFKTAADVTYTPESKWTYNLRYRHFDMTSDNTNQFLDYDNESKIDDPGPPPTINPLDVRNSMDIRRAWYEMIVNYRPTNKLTLKGEFSLEDINRSNTGPEISHSSRSNPITINPNWQLPDEETILRGKIGFHSRMLEKSALKLSGWLALQHSDDPAYGSSFRDSRQLFLSSSYNPSPYWGVLANVKLLQEVNKKHELHDFNLEREKQQENVGIGTYYSTDSGLSFNFNYGYLNTNVDQDVLFGTGPTSNGYNYAIPAYNAGYDQTVHTLSAGMAWQVLENVNCGLDAYHIRSDASFSPYFDPIVGVPIDISGVEDTTTSSSDGLSEISKIDIRQNGIKGRVNWQVDDNWGCSIEVAYDDYNDRNSNVYDGSVVSTMVSLSRVW